MRISDEARLVVAKLSADVENSLVMVVLSVFLVSSERDKREGRGDVGEIVHDGVRIILKNDRRRGAAAQQLRCGAFVQQQILVGA